MSKQADEIYDVLIKLFPLGTVMKEEYINYEGTRLFFDFYIKDMGVLIEVQGRQHTKFVKHFHGDKETFVKQKHRDNLKIAYIQGEDKLCLVRFNYNEKVTDDLVKSKIYNALKSKESFYE